MFDLFRRRSSGSTRMGGERIGSRRTRAAGTIDDNADAARRRRNESDWQDLKWRRREARLQAEGNDDDLRRRDEEDRLRRQRDDQERRERERAEDDRRRRAEADDRRRRAEEDRDRDRW